MRVAFLVSHFPVVSETFILDQITGLIDRGCEVEIFADEPAPAAAVHPEVDAYGLKAHVLRMPPGGLGRLAAALGVAAANPGGLRPAHFRSLNFARYGRRAASLRLFFETVICTRRPPFDIIHCHFGPNGLRGLALRDVGALRGRIITSFYGYDVSAFVQQQSGNPYAALFSRSDLTLALSQVMQDRLIDLGCPRSRTRVHHLGVNPSLFLTGRREGDRPIRILTVGRMVEKKGLEDALRAVAAVASDTPGIEYEIIGDGPLRPRIEQTIDELDLRSIVRLAGWQARPEVVTALGRADILLAPSVTAKNGDEEGTPVIIMEAMASALPVISTQHAGIPEVVEDGASGVLVPEHDVAGLTAALRCLISSPGLRAGMGACGRSITEAHYDIRKLNDRLMETYRDLADSSGGSVRA